MTMTSKNLEPKESPSWGIPLLQRIISKTSDTSKDDHHTVDAQNVNDAKYTEKQPLTTNTTCSTDGANLVGIYDETESHHGTTEETPKSSQHAKADGTDLQSINDQAPYHFDPKGHFEDNCSKNETHKKPSKSSDKFVKIKSKRTITRPRKLKDKECEIISKTETSLAKHINAKPTDSQFKPVAMTTLSAMSHQVENLETVQTGKQEGPLKANTETIVNLETVNNLQDQAESTELHQILPKESVAIETVSIETKTRQQEKAVNFDDFEIQFEDDPPPKTDFICSKPRRGRPPKNDRRKSRQSMNFTASISLTSTLSEPTETCTTRVPKSSSTDISSDSGISEIALNDLHLPFDEDDQSQCSPKPIQRPKRKRQGRKSADFDIINTSAIILSPELDPGMISVNADIVPPLGAARRSKRIRRKSLEIFRQSQHEKEQKLQLIETLNSTSAAVTKSLPTNVQPQNSPSSYPHPHDTTLHPQGTTLHPEDTNLHPQDTTLHPEDTTLHPQETTLHPTTTKHEDTKTYNKCNAELKNKSPNYVSNMIHNVTLVEEHLHETVHRVDTTVFDIPAVIEPPVLNTCESVGAKNRIIKQSFSRKYSPEKCKEGEPESLGRGKRAKKTLVNYAELDQCDEEDSSRSPKKKRKKEDVSIEDIYKNKNYVAPAEKPWETIYETPHHNDVMTKKKFKRTVMFEDYSIGRLKKRRQKAMKNGWKPPRMGKKKTELLEKTLDKKLASLEEEIENNFPNSPQPSTSSTGSSFVPYNNNGPLAIAEQPHASSSPAKQQTEQNSVPTISESEIPKDSKNSLKQQKSSKRKCPPKRKSSKKQSELEKVESHNENETHENTVIPDNIVIPDTIETSDMVETNEKVDIKDEVKTQDKVESQIKIDKTKDKTGSTQDLNIDVKAISSETKSEVKVFEGEVHVDVKKEPSLLTESSNNTNKVGVIIEPPDHVDVKVENISMDEITDNGAIPEDLNAEDKKIGDVKSVVDMEPNKEMEVDLFFTPMKDIPVPSQKGNEMSNSNDDGDISGLDTIAEESIKETMETSQTKALSETYHVSKEPVSGSKNVCDESKESFSESKADDYLTPQTTLSDTDTNSSLLNATANESLLEGVFDSSDEAVQSLNSSLDSLDPIQLLEKSRNSRIADDTRDLLTPVSEEDLNTGEYTQTYSSRGPFEMMEYIEPVTFPQLRHVQLWRPPVFNLCNQIYTVAPVLLPGPPYPNDTTDSTESQGNATNNEYLDTQRKGDASLIINAPKSPNDDSEESLNEDPCSIAEESKSLDEDNSSLYEKSVNEDTYTKSQHEEESSQIDDPIFLIEDSSEINNTSSLHKDNGSIFDVSESLKEESTSDVEKNKALSENTYNSSPLNACNDVHNSISVVELKDDNNRSDSSSVIATSLIDDDTSVIDESLNETNNTVSDISKSLNKDKKSVMCQNEVPVKKYSSILKKSLNDDSMIGTSNTVNEEGCYVLDSTPSNNSDSKTTESLGEEIQCLMIDQDESLNEDSKLETIHSLETFILDDGDSIPTGHVEEMIEYDFSQNIDSSCPDDPGIDASNENDSQTENSINFSLDQITSTESGSKEEKDHIKIYISNPQEENIDGTQIPNPLEKKLGKIQTFKSNPLIPDVTPIALHPFMSEQIRFGSCCPMLPCKVVERLSTPDIVDSLPRVLREGQATSLQPWSIKSSTPLLEESRSVMNDFPNYHGNKPTQELLNASSLCPSSDCVPDNHTHRENPLCDEATVEATQSVLYQTAADTASVYHTPCETAAVCTADKLSIADDSYANHDDFQCNGIEQSVDEDNESTYGRSRSLSEKTLTELRLDSPVLSPAQQHACLLKRRQQVDAYRRQNAHQPSFRYPRRYSETPGQAVNWSERLVQMTIYDENVWCDPLDDTLEL